MKYPRTARIIAAGLLRRARNEEPGAQAWDLCVLAGAYRNDYPAYADTIYRELREVAIRFGLPYGPSHPRPLPHSPTPSTLTSKGNR
jgi:hypothetical protein